MTSRKTCRYLIEISNIYILFCQASEWGMRGLQGSFPRFKKRLPGNPVKQKLVIQSIVLVHNFRSEIVELNQIRTVFDPEYESHYMVMTGEQSIVFPHSMLLNRAHYSLLFHYT
jgi:hypothetical protein